MIFNLLTAPNNAYNHAFQRYVRPQNYNVLKRVWGKWQEWTPNTRYAEESARDVGLVKKFKAGAPIKNPAQAAKAAALAAKGAPHYHDPEKGWTHLESRPRSPMAKPTSTALGRISYDPRTEIVNFQFRTKTGLGKTYSSLMSGEAFYRWVGKSRSIGKYFNRYLKGRMTPG